MRPLRGIDDHCARQISPKRRLFNGLLAEGGPSSCDDGEHGIHVASPTRSPEEQASTREAARALDAALQALPQDEATVLLLARMEGMSYEEIARVVGRTPAATKQLAYRALQRIRASMTSAGHGEET